ncbi:MAG: DUF2721 domain-containing protein [Phycisphaerae bacterium]|nr:DUF2721 domain-containing protein [Tepidisphaeraceae bacterium]
MPIEQNPFAILTFIAAPAILTNACSTLALGTSNRFARNIDRARVLIKLIEDAHNPNTPPRPPAELALWHTLLGILHRRSTLLVRALSAFYFGIGSFAAASLASLLGAILSATNHPHLLIPVLVVALASGVAGLLGLGVGGATLVKETRLAMRAITEESRYYAGRLPEAPNAT